LALGELEYLVGRWHAAADCFDRATQAARRNDQTSRIGGTLAVWATLEAASGDPELAAARIEEARSIAERCGDPVVSLWVTMQAGLVAHFAGDSETAVSLLSAAQAEDDRHGIREPGFRRYEADLVEALIMSGRLSDAESALTAALQMALAVNRPSGIAAAFRAQALLWAAHGRHDQAVDAVHSALRAHERVAMPFERARTLLVAGGIHRRRRAKRAASDSLQAALAGFRQVGAHTFAARAADELARIGLRQSPSAELTATERRIAELAAAGMTNAEISARMFVTTRTVETHLTHIYRKLGIRFRSQLGVRLAESPAGGR
jgi:DNA-binding CsgD family transcriptional regulator